MPKQPIPPKKKFTAHMYSWFFGTTIERVRAEIVLCLGAETPVQATRFYNSELVLKKGPPLKKRD